MNVEEYIVARTNALLQTTDACIVKRLEGGMSNYTYIVESQGKKYTYRVPGKSAEHFVDRVDELHTIEQVERLGFASTHSYMEVRTGEKLAEYVDGTILTDDDVETYNTLVAKRLHQIHESGMQLPLYDPFGRLNRYEGYCRDLGYVHPQNYIDLRQKLDSCRQQIPQVPLVPCHCDFQPSNIVISGTTVNVLDWEFAGMNDPIYDVACYGNVGFDSALSFLSAYVGHEPSRQEKQRLFFYRAFQCMQWYNVAIFKDRIGLSKDLNMDFCDVAEYFYNQAKDLLAGFDSI